MTKRKLTEIEKRICLKQIARMKEELKHLDYLQRYHKNMIDEGLYFNYLERLKQQKAEFQVILNEIKINHEKINLLSTQIKDGVEIIKQDKLIGVG